MSKPNLDHLTRQLEIIPVSALGQKITVIGAGAIGSFAILSLVKMGFEQITVYDFDDVSVENMNCQWFRFSDVGKKKVDALKSLIHDFTGTEIKVIAERYEGVKPRALGGTPAGWLEGIVISSVDSMAARRLIWENILRCPGVTYLIDPRMASEYALAYVMDPHSEADRATYEKVLYSDEAAIQERCTAKATMYTATMIAGYVAKQVKDIVTKNPYARVSHWDIGLNNLQNWPKAPVTP